MKRKATIQRQKPIKGGREPLPSCVIKAIRDRVESLATRYHVSKSFVIAVALADQFGISDQERYQSNLKVVKRA